VLLEKTLSTWAKSPLASILLQASDFSAMFNRNSTTPEIIKQAAKLYTEGIAELQARAREMFPGVDKFSVATAVQQDEILRSLDENAASIGRPFRPRPRRQNFFETLRQHTIAGFLVGGNLLAASVIWTCLYFATLHSGPGARCMRCFHFFCRLPCVSSRQQTRRRSDYAWRRPGAAILGDTSEGHVGFRSDDAYP
jgi:Gluconate 2-dehydrogenase subunit 3